MDVAQSGTESAGFSPKGEDLDVVMGRFQSWAKTQRINLGKSIPSSSKLSPESREISYEQAMRVSSYRRPMDPPDLTDLTGLGSLGPLPAKVHSDRSPVANVPIPMAAAAVKVSASYLRQPVAGDTVPIEELGTADVPLASLRFAQAAQAISSAPDLEPLLEIVSVATAKETAVHPGKRSKSRTAAKTIPVVEASNRKTAAAKSAQTTSRKRRVPKTVQQTISTQVAPLMQLSSEKAIDLECRESGTEAHFDDVFERAIAAGAAKQFPNVTYERAALNSLTAQISDEEKVRLESMGAKANLSVASYYRECGLHGEQTTSETRGSQTDLAESIYLRQCALGVDELNDQVEVALARLYKQHSPGSLPVPRKLPPFAEILRRFARYFRHRTWPRPTLAPAVRANDRANLPAAPLNAP
jgi:hypothetical protein